MAAPIAIDIFTTTNPAFGALLLWRFSSGYCAAKTDGVELPLLYLPMPLLLSSDLFASFNGTNATTGFMSWINRAQYVSLDLPRRLFQTTAFSLAAIEFSVRQQLLKPTANGTFLIDKTAIKKKPARPATTLTGRQLMLAERLGQWMAEVPTSTIFFSLGITL